MNPLYWAVIGRALFDDEDAVVTCMAATEDEARREFANLLCMREDEPPVSAEDVVITFVLCSTRPIHVSYAVLD